MKKLKWNGKSVSGKNLLDRVGKPVAAGLAGAALGHFAGKGGNLLAAAGLGVASLGFNMPLLASAAIGAAVVTPPKSTVSLTGVDGIDGVKEWATEAFGRTKGYAKAQLTNVGLESVASKINGIGGIDDVDDSYMNGYANGVEDTESMYGVGQLAYSEELNGFHDQYSDKRLIGSTVAKTPEAVLLGRSNAA